MFHSDDGFMLYDVNDRWVDNLDPANVDLMFDRQADGWPIDDMREPLHGVRGLLRQDTDADGQPHEVLVVLVDNFMRLEVPNTQLGRHYIETYTQIHLTPFGF